MSAALMQLGFDVDTSPLVSANDRLDALGQSAQRSGGYLQQFAKGFEDIGKSAVSSLSTAPLSKFGDALNSLTSSTAKARDDLGSYFGVYEKHNKSILDMAEDFDRATSSQLDFMRGTGQLQSGIFQTIPLLADYAKGYSDIDESIRLATARSTEFEGARSLMTEGAKLALDATQAEIDGNSLLAQSYRDTADMAQTSAAKTSAVWTAMEAEIHRQQQLTNPTEFTQQQKIDSIRNGDLSGNISAFANNEGDLLTGLIKLADEAQATLAAKLQDIGSYFTETGDHLDATSVSASRFAGVLKDEVDPSAGSLISGALKSAVEGIKDAYDSLFGSAEKANQAMAATGQLGRSGGSSGLDSSMSAGVGFLAGRGTVGRALSALGPYGMAAGAIAGIAEYSTEAAASVGRDLSLIDAHLDVTGQRASLSAGLIENWSKKISAQTSITETDLRKIALQLVDSAKVPTSSFESTLAIVSRLGATFGEFKEPAGIFIKAQDDAKGAAEDFNRKLGIFTADDIKKLEELADAGKKEDALKIFFEKTSDAASHLSSSTKSLTAGFNDLKNSLNDIIERFGFALVNAFYNAETAATKFYNSGIRGINMAIDAKAGLEHFTADAANQASSVIPSVTTGPSTGSAFSDFFSRPVKLSWGSATPASPSAPPQHYSELPLPDQPSLTGGSALGAGLSWMAGKVRAGGDAIGLPQLPHSEPSGGKWAPSLTDDSSSKDDGSSKEDSIMAILRQTDALKHEAEAWKLGDSAVLDAAAADQAHAAFVTEATKDETAYAKAVKARYAAQADAAGAKDFFQQHQSNQDYKELLDQVTAGEMKLGEFEDELDNKRRERALEAAGYSGERISALMDEYETAKELTDQYDQLNEKQTKMDATWKAIGNSIDNAFTRPLEGAIQLIVKGQGATIKWANLADAAMTSLMGDMIKMSMINPFKNAMLGTNEPTLSGAGGLLGGLGGSISRLFGGGGLTAAGVANFAGDPEAGFALNAKGNAFYGGNVVPFAKGSAFTNSIISKPTLFPMATGSGLMAEAGPEAVMPLTRASDGSLGVRAPGGGSGGGGVVIQVIDQRTGAGQGEAGGSISTQDHGMGPDFKRLFTVTVRDVVNQGLKAGEFDKSMNSTYGARRTPARR